MNNDIYPDCQIITRNIEAGELSKYQLLHKMKQHSILLNTFAEILFADNRFPITLQKCTFETVELSVCNLGLPEGGTITQIFDNAKKLGLKLCPVELGPYLRLAYLDQPEGNTKVHPQHQAPNGSITVASEFLTADDAFPKGFYLRRIDGELWLRGYICDDEHKWNPGDRFVFIKGMFKKTS